MRIAVLGASGFIGSRVAEKLRLDGLADIRPVVRDSSKLAETIRLNSDCRIADAFDQKSLTSAFGDCDVVVYAVGGNRKTILGTLAPVYNAACDAGVKRLVYMSTASVHGQTPDPGANEESVLHEKHSMPYNNSKVRAERTLRKLREKGVVELVILRPGIVYGPNSRWNVEFVSEILDGTAYFINNGEGICNGIYVDNLVHAVYLASTSKNIDKEAFLVGDTETYTWKEFHEPIAEAFGIDISQIPNLKYEPQEKGWRELMPFRLGFKLLSALVRRLPKAFRGPMQKILGLPISEKKSSLGGISNFEPTSSVPVPDLETSLLHKCSYKFPNDKAKRLMNYEAIISFQEGMTETIAWFDSDGFPIVKKK